MRWLLSQGRVKEVVEMLNKIARVNHRYIPEDILQKFTVRQSFFFFEIMPV